MEQQLGLTLEPDGGDDDAAGVSGSGGGSSGGVQQPQQQYRLEPSASCLFEDQMELVGALTNYIKTAVLRHVADCFRLAKVSPTVRAL